MSHGTAACPCRAARSCRPSCSRCYRGSFGSAREFVVRARLEGQEGGDADTEATAQAVTRALDEGLGAGRYRIARTEAVGPKVGRELQGKAGMAILFSFVTTLIYLAFRFEWRFGLAAVLATAHDILATVAFIRYLDLEVSLVVVAAVLTVLGYSLNDTIVIFDRVRENLRKYRRQDLLDILNLSVNETLPRTILTGGTTLATALVLSFFAGEVIRPFALVMSFGIIVGTFSSIYVASPLLLWIERHWRGEDAREGRLVGPTPGGGGSALDRLWTTGFCDLPPPLNRVAPHGVAAAGAFLMITFLHIVLGELAPKGLALLHPERTSRWVAPPLILFTKATNPFIWLLNGTANAILRLFGTRAPSERERVHSPEEIMMLVEQTRETGRIDAQDARMIGGVFEFTEANAREVMTPRTDMPALDVSMSLREAANRVRLVGRSRYPVYRESLDDIVGTVHAKDVLAAFATGEGRTVEDILRPTLFVPSTREVEEVLSDMRRQRTHLAIVLDEFGGTAGRSEEHTSELQSPCNLVCRLLLEKKKEPQTESRR